MKAEDTSWLAVLSDWVNLIDEYVWGAPLVCAILSVGVALTFALKFRNILSLKRAFGGIFHPANDRHEGEVSAFGALCTALSATIGTGNIVGVATAIGTGGPGALFWMEVAALFGMATKYAEGLLAVKYREITPEGRVLGGPFYYIEKGLGRKWKWLAIMFAVSGVLAGIMGIGTITQINGITSAVQNFFEPSFNSATVKTGVSIFGVTYSYSAVIAGLFVTISSALVIIGGIKRIAKVSMVVVPFMAVAYVLVCLTVLFSNASRIPEALMTIFQAAFNPQAFTGGAVGTIFIAMQKGIARGIFSNEAGLGSAPIAAAAAKTDNPVQQGLVCMTGTFIDTIVICTMTGLAIVLSGTWDPALGLAGVDITIAAFSKLLWFLPNGSAIASLFLMLSLSFFAFTTILGWNYYSEKCLEYIVGSNRIGWLKAFRILYVMVVFVGPYLTVSLVWNIADIFNGLMALPNLIALTLLMPVVIRESRDL